MSEHRSFSEFRDPKLSDRELMLLVLYEVARLRADVKILTAGVARTVTCTAAEESKIVADADRDALAELEQDIRQFETRPQRPSQQ